MHSGNCFVKKTHLFQYLKVPLDKIGGSYIKRELFYKELNAEVVVRGTSNFRRVWCENKDFTQFFLPKLFNGQLCITNIDNDIINICYLK